MDVGSRLTLEIEKPTAGGRMLARHEGRIVLVWGGIPGERVGARVERVAKGVVYADTDEVLSATSDRRATVGDWRCGGNVLAHVHYPRQLQLKADIIRDAFTRIARLPLATAPVIAPSEEVGYRMRARLHAQGDRLGFYREGTHQLCEAAATGQLSAAAVAWITGAEEILRRERPTGLAAIELTETVAGDARAAHLDLHAGAGMAAWSALSPGLVGLSARRADRPRVTRLAGDPVVTDTLHARAGDPTSAFRLRRDVRSFFQGNRFLIERLVTHVTAQAGPGPVVDLYAGVGLFGLALAAAGAEPVTLVESDPVSGADLRANADPFGRHVSVVHERVEPFLGSSRRDPGSGGTYIVDPPRTGLSKEAIRGLRRLLPPRIVYVSCDVATLARDARALVDAGYEMERIDGFDLFPNTAHVETVVVFASGHRDPPS